MYILGISCFYHDSAACLIKDGKIIAAAEEERFTRKKHDNTFPFKAIEYCLREGKIEINDVKFVGFYEKPFLKFDRIIQIFVETFPSAFLLFYNTIPSWINEKLRVKSIIRRKLGFKGDILFVDHHTSHAASAFYASPFEEAAILTVDGVGEWTTAAMGLGKNTDIKLFKEIKFPHSLGLLYSTFTAFLGFKVNNGEYKVMGMAPYGQPKYVEKIYDNLVKVASDGSFWLNMDYFSYHYSEEKTFNSKFERLFGQPRDPGLKFFTSKTRFPSYYGSKPDNYRQLCRQNEHYADVAASIQRVTEEILLKLAISLYKETGMKNLCLAGGVGLNSKANGRILMETPFNQLFIQPAAGDSGGALGAALYVYHGLLGKPRTFVLEHAYWGKEYSEREIKEFLKKNNINYEYLAKEEELTTRIVDEIMAGKVIGLFQGRFEWGPRALGNRSILADPRREEMKDIVNLKIKFREPFRPFAPVILEEEAESFFAANDFVNQFPVRYMLLVLPWKEEKADKMRAVNHLGTARLQTIREEWNPRYYQIIKKFGQATGAPVLLNTSFNLKGEPIVNSPLDAFTTFRRSGLDLLVLEKFIIKK